MSRLKPALIGASAAASVLVAFAAGVPARATNLVLNGDFENSSPNNTSTWPTSAGGIGQIDNIVTLSDWTKTSVAADGSDGFAFVINKDADFDNGNSYPSQGGGFPSKFSNSSATNLFLWGPNSVTYPLNNGFSGPPGSSATNKFIGAGGDYGASVLTQIVTGFDTSKQYVLSYDFAGSQLTTRMGDTNQQWKVLLGTVDHSVPELTNPSQGFTPWLTYMSNPFTPSAASLTLRFESWGRAVTGGSGSGSSDPFLLLDNVKILEQAAPPPPSVPGPLPVLGIGMTFAWSRRLRRQIAASAKV